MNDPKKERKEILDDIGRSLGTLRSAVSNISTGEHVEGCELPVQVGREMAHKQIKRIRDKLKALEQLI